MKGARDTTIRDYHRGFIQITKPLDQLDDNHAEATMGYPAQNPQVELCIPTVHDRSPVPRGRHADPNLPGSVLHREVLTPLDLERRPALTGGHHNHGDMEPDQLFFLRPVRGHADYRTPLEGLYLCGAGTHPGGGVSGANGRNCARQFIRDLKRGWWK